MQILGPLLGKKIYFHALNEADLVSHQYPRKHHLNFHIGQKSPGHAWRPCPKVMWPWSVNVNRTLTSFPVLFLYVAESFESFVFTHTAGVDDGNVCTLGKTQAI